MQRRRDLTRVASPGGGGEWHTSRASPQGGRPAGGTSRCCCSAQAPRPSSWCTVPPPGRGLVIGTACPQRPAGISQGHRGGQDGAGCQGHWPVGRQHRAWFGRCAEGCRAPRRHPPPTGWVSAGPQAGGRLRRARLARHWLGTEPPPAWPSHQGAQRPGRQTDGQGTGPFWSGGRRVPRRVSQRVPIGLLRSAGLWSVLGT